MGTNNIYTIQFTLTLFYVPSGVMIWWGHIHKIKLQKHDKYQCKDLKREMVPAP